MIQLTKFNKLADIYFRGPLCRLKWILIPAGVKTQPQSTFKVKCKLHPGILQRKQLHSLDPKSLLLCYALMRAHLTDRLSELENSLCLRNIKVHFTNKKIKCDFLSTKQFDNDFFSISTRDLESLNSL